MAGNGPVARLNEVKAIDAQLTPWQLMLWQKRDSEGLRVNGQLWCYELTHTESVDRLLYIKYPQVNC